MQNIYGDGTGDSEKIEIYLSARKLKNMDFFSKSDPQIRLYQQINGQWQCTHQTETKKDDLNPNFTKTFVIDFVFEQSQPIKFEAVDVDGKNSFDLIGTVETTVGKLMGTKNQTMIQDLKTKNGKFGGKLVLRAERISQSKNLIHMQWAGKKLMNTDGWFDKSDPFLRILKSRNNDEWLKVHETEYIKDNLNPMWKPFQLKEDRLNSAKDDQPFKVEVWDWEKSQKFQFIGFTDITVKEIKQGKREWDLSNPKKKKKTGTLVLTNFQVIERPSFLDFIRGGDQLNVVTAIDFTGSNGHPNSPSSLHFRSPQAPNQYQRALQSVCDILLAYDYDQQVAVFGFGGKPKYPQMSSNQVDHCFACTGNPQNPNVQGMPGILDVYNYAINNVELSGPTFFAPIITEAMKLAEMNKVQESNVYTILLILTDGEIHDMQKTVDLVVQASQLPLSIIIVGVGEADFGKMDTLDGDSGLYNSRGEKAKRDLVQFVPFRNFKGNQTALAKAVLAEVPEQLVDYNKLIGRKPRPASQVDITKVAMEGINQQQQQQQGGQPQSITVNIQGGEQQGFLNNQQMMQNIGSSLSQQQQQGYYNQQQQGYNQQQGGFNQQQGGGYPQQQQGGYPQQQGGGGYQQQGNQQFGGGQQQMPFNQGHMQQMGNSMQSQYNQQQQQGYYNQQQQGGYNQQQQGGYNQQNYGGNQGY